MASVQVTSNIWTRQEISTLIEIWGDPSILELFDGQSHGKRNITYGIICDRLGDFGFNRHTKQVAKKIQRLRNGYFNAKKALRLGTANEKTVLDISPYYAQLDRFISSEKVSLKRLIKDGEIAPDAGDEVNSDQQMFTPSVCHFMSDFLVDDAPSDSSTGSLVVPNESPSPSECYLDPVHDESNAVAKNIKESSNEENVPVDKPTASNNDPDSDVEVISVNGEDQKDAPKDVSRSNGVIIRSLLDSRKRSCNQKVLPIIKKKIKLLNGSDLKTNVEPVHNDSHVNISPSSDNENISKMEEFFMKYFEKTEVRQKAHEDLIKKQTEVLLKLTDELKNFTSQMSNLVSHITHESSHRDESNSDKS